MVPSIVDASSYSVQTLNPLKSPPQSAQVATNAEDVINGTNLSKLFSVYEPKSWQQKKRSRQVQPQPLGIGLDMIEPEQHTEHLKMLKQMLQEGTL